MTIMSSRRYWRSSTNSGATPGAHPAEIHRVGLSGDAEDVRPEIDVVIPRGGALARVLPTPVLLLPMVLNRSASPPTAVF